jgi:sodium-dependent dicarboxylate transporter 2/3/5
VSDSASDHLPSDTSTFNRLAHIAQWSGLILGPIVAFLVYRLTDGTQGLSDPGRRVIALASIMAVWWLSEAIPVSITALLPVALLPLLKVCTIKQAAAPYADEILFLFMGGFIIGEAIQRSGLHRRVALLTLLGVGTSPARMVGGVMLATCLISMWVSNTATTIMMLPIGMSIVALVDARSKLPGAESSGWNPHAVRNFGVAIVLGIAYAASIGGMATPVGTPPNLIMLNYVQKSLHRDIDFATWITLGLPLVAVFLPMAWLLLTRVLHPSRAAAVPGGRALIQEELGKIGRPSRAEWITLSVFLATSAAWIGRERLTRGLELSTRVVDSGGVARDVGLLTDAGIAILAALAFFLIPVRLHPRRAVVQWHEVERLPWGILLLFGGGLSIADAMGRTGVDVYLGSLFQSLGHLPMLLIILILVASVTFVGELASNAAVVAALMPVTAAAAKGMGMDPLPLMFAVTLGSSCGFMLPVATPPNALAYATGRVTQPQMVRAGFLLDITGIALVTIAVYLGGKWLLGAG